MDSNQHRTVGGEPSSFHSLDKRSFFGMFNRRERVPIEVRKCSHQGRLYSTAAAVLKYSSHHFRCPCPPAAIVRAKAREPSHHSFETPEKKTILD
jgi:hypothetical protein